MILATIVDPRFKDKFFDESQTCCQKHEAALILERKALLEEYGDDQPDQARAVQVNQIEETGL